MMPVAKTQPSLYGKIAQRIRQNGPISVADYVRTCLSDAEFGYYTNAPDPLGTNGDFTTAPEISQAFGEMIGLFLEHCRHNLNIPRPFSVCELGPGRGTLMADALRAASSVGDFAENAHIFLHDINPVLIQKQEQALAAYNPNWIQDITELTKQPCFFIANEFFDCLPAQQFVFDGEFWRERQVALDKGGALQFTTSKEIAEISDYVQFLPAGAPDKGNIWEFCPDAAALMQSLSSHINNHGGMAIIVDYGYINSAFGDSLQALQDHKFADPLADPGRADLTFHVNFDLLTAVAESCGLEIQALTTQGEFLRAIGIEKRLGQLLQKANEAQKQDLQTGVKRLIDPDQMGDLFKVLVIARGEKG